MSSTYDPGSARARTGPTAGRQPGTYQEYGAYEDYGYSDSAIAAGLLLVLGGFWGFFIGLSAVISTSYYKSLPAYSSLHNYTYHWNPPQNWSAAPSGLTVCVVRPNFGNDRGCALDLNRNAAGPTVVRDFEFVPAFEISHEDLSAKRHRKPFGAADHNRFGAFRHRHQYERPRHRNVGKAKHRINFARSCFSQLGLHVSHALPHFGQSIGWHPGPLGDLR
jgi:hypothetical protein